MASELDALGLRHGTDKASNGHDYLTFYERWFAKWRHRPVRLFEMGTLGGNSLRLWREYFPNGDVTGLELEADYWKPENEPACRVINGSQNDSNLLDRIGRERGPFDIIIDDAGHFFDGQTTALKALFETYLRPGGVYIIEDVHAAYWPEYNDQGRKQLMPWLYAWVDANVMRRGADQYNRFTQDDAVAGMTFRKGVVIIEKAE